MPNKYCLTVGIKMRTAGPSSHLMIFPSRDGDHSLSPEDLASIEGKMTELAKRDVPYIREERSWADAVDYFRKKNDPYKLDLLEGLKGETITFYHQGNFTDLCFGPHLPSTGRIKSIKLLSVAGAYWRGDEKNLTTSHASPAVIKIETISAPIPTSCVPCSMNAPSKTQPAMNAVSSIAAMNNVQQMTAIAFQPACLTHSGSTGIDLKKCGMEENIFFITHLLL
jgi:hypothetical protein